MANAPKQNRPKNPFSYRDWTVRILLAGTIGLIILYTYLIFADSNSVSEPLRSDLIAVQESHLLHNHREALDRLTPVRRFQNTKLSDRATRLKEKLQAVLERQETIQKKYKSAMEHQVDSEGNLTPSEVEESINDLEREFNRLWKRHEKFLQQHPETPPPYSDIENSMLDLILHRIVRVKSSSGTSSERLFEYKFRMYSRLLEKSGSMINGTPEPHSYRDTLSYVSSLIDLLENTKYEPQANQLHHKLRTKIADHFERINKDGQEELKKKNYDQAIQIFNDNRQNFRGVSPWDQVIQNRIKTIKKIKKLEES